MGKKSKILIVLTLIPFRPMSPLKPFGPCQIVIEIYLKINKHV